MITEQRKYELIACVVDVKWGKCGIYQGHIRGAKLPFAKVTVFVTKNEYTTFEYAWETVDNAVKHNLTLTA